MRFTELWEAELASLKTVLDEGGGDLSSDPTVQGLIFGALASAAKAFLQYTRVCLSFFQGANVVPFKESPCYEGKPLVANKSKKETCDAGTTAPLSHQEPLIATFFLTLTKQRDGDPLMTVNQAARPVSGKKLS